MSVPPPRLLHVIDSIIAKHQQDPAYLEDLLVLRSGAAAEFGMLMQEIQDLQAELADARTAADTQKRGRIIERLIFIISKFFGDDF